MNISSGCEQKQLTFNLDGELDHHAAKNAMRYIGREIDINLPSACTLNMSGVGFMDSSGIALILGTYKRMRELGGTLSVENLQNQAKRVLSAAGVHKIIDLK